MAATLTADAFAHDAPGAAEAPKSLTFHQTPVAQSLDARRKDALNRVLEGVPEYKVKDVSNEFHSAHAMGVQRGNFHIQNGARNTDEDWRANHEKKVETFNEASSKTPAEAAMNTNEIKAYQAAREAGRGDAWKEAWALGKEEAVRRAEYEGVKDIAFTGAKLLAKDAVGLVTEGPVGEAMAVRDGLSLMERAPKIAAVAIASGATGAAAVMVMNGYAKALEERAVDSIQEFAHGTRVGLGISNETANAATHAAQQGYDTASSSMSTFHGHTNDFAKSGDAAFDKAGNAISGAIAPASEAIGKVAHEALKGAEPYTAPVTQGISDASNALGHALEKGLDARVNAITPASIASLRTQFLMAVEHNGSQSLTRAEAEQVFKELAYVEKGDRLIIESHAIHIVPAGTPMPNVPHGAITLPDADLLRAGLGIERAPAQAHAQPTAQPQQLAQAHGGMER